MCMYIYIYIYVHIYLYICIYIIFMLLCSVIDFFLNNQPDALSIQFYSGKF